MDEFGTTAGATGSAVPDQLRSLFNRPGDVRVQELPCALPGLASLAVHFGAGTRTVPQCLATQLRAPGVGVVLEAEHRCESLRGVRAGGATTVTSALLGTLRADPASRAEFFALAGVPRETTSGPRTAGREGA